MPEPYHIVDVTAAGPKELLIEAPVPHLIVYAAGEDRSRLLHSLTASTDSRARHGPPRASEYKNVRPDVW